jgi:hypothetical protein
LPRRRLGALWHCGTQNAKDKPEIFIYQGDYHPAVEVTHTTQVFPDHTLVLIQIGYISLMCLLLLAGRGLNTSLIHPDERNML